MKKKIGLLTLDSKIYNYGGILQEYALLKTLKKYGDAEIINYDVSTELNTFSIKRSILNISLEKLIKRKNKNNSISLKKDVSEHVRIRKMKFDEFRTKYINLSDNYVYPDLTHKELNYNFVVCGSDQIWNPDYNIPSFFLNFTKNAKKIIYAASIGKENLTNRQKRIYGKLINHIDYVSVRENSAKKLLEQHTKKDIKVVLDPTFLLEKKEWVKICQIPSDLDNYIFCYFLENSEEKISAVKEYAEQNNKKIVSIPYLHGQYESLCEEIGGVQLDDVGPNEFLGLIFGADVVITDSFHATVFSLIFSKKFVVFGRNAGNYNMNTRIENLLSFFAADRHLIQPKDIFSHQFSSDYSLSNIQKMIKLSKEYLDESLKN